MTMKDRMTLAWGMLTVAALAAFCVWLGWNTSTFLSEPKALCDTDTACEVMFDQAGPAGTRRAI